jgi:hypothetical protein
MSLVRYRGHSQGFYIRGGHDPQSQEDCISAHVVRGIARVEKRGIATRIRITEGQVCCDDSKTKTDQGSYG